MNRYFANVKKEHAMGKSVEQIAADLALCTTTVRRYILQIEYAKRLDK